MHGRVLSNSVSRLYRRRMSFRLPPASISSFRSTSAAWYSRTCHSRLVFSGLPASSQRTNERISVSLGGMTMDSSMPAGSTFFRRYSTRRTASSPMRASRCSSVSAGPGVSAAARTATRRGMRRETTGTRRAPRARPPSSGARRAPGARIAPPRATGSTIGVVCVFVRARVRARVATAASRTRTSRGPKNTTTPVFLKTVASL